MADVAIDVGTHESHGSFAASIGGYYPLLREDFTPYIGGVVRWAFMNLGGNGASGLMLQPTVGVLLGRLSSVQLRAEVGYFIDTFGEPEKVAGALDTSPATNGPKHYSHGFALNVGIGF